MSHKPERRGSALLTVLWLCAALSAIGLAVASNVRGETERASTNVDDTKSYFLARGAIERAALHMFWGPDYYTFGNPSMDFDFPEGQVHVDIVPETSKLGLNQVPGEEVLRVLLALGVPGGNATEMAAAILDWRLPQDPAHGSPFDGFYLGQNPSFQPPHTSFMESEELLLVRGITPDLYYGTSLDGSRAGLRDCLSVFGSSVVDVNTARAETMIGIGIAGEDAAALVRSRQRSAMGYPELARIQASLGPAGSRLRIGGNFIYTVRATARLRDAGGRLSDLRRSVSALIRLNWPGNKRGKAPGFEVIRWYDRA